MRTYGLDVRFLNLTQCSRRWNMSVIHLSTSWKIQMRMFQFRN